MNDAEATLGQEPPLISTRPPGEHSRSFLLRHAHATAPMGPKKNPGDRPSGIVYASALGSNVVDVDGNRYVDLAAGFGAELLGHRHPAILRALSLESGRLLHALGDLYPSDAKVGLVERIVRLYPEPSARVIVAQSGSDAVSAALKTAALFTGRPGVLAFGAAYHGLGYGPLAALGLRASYRSPFAEQLNPHVASVPYPDSTAALAETLAAARTALSNGAIGAVLIEPILGRGGVIVPPSGFLRELQTLASEHGAVLIADEVWTGLGRSGSLLRAVDEGVTPELVCLGKGLGGGLPISAVIGKNEVMRAWERDDEVVHTSTFAGMPLACATALATLDTIGRERLVQRSATVGAAFKAELAAGLAAVSGVSVRGEGLMLGVDLGAGAHAAVRVVRRLLERGFIATTGGGQREVLVLTPPLNIAESLLSLAVAAVVDVVRAGP
jgi:4-aminobutyrate aminotransferase/(S)-3-amino-2-methylpropionate transaminase